MTVLNKCSLYDGKKKVNACGYRDKKEISLIGKDCERLRIVFGNNGRRLNLVFGAKIQHKPGVTQYEEILVRC
jgi:hypothetical protein